MDQAGATYTPSWRERLIKIYTASWVNETYAAYSAWKREDWVDLNDHLNAAIVYLRMVLDLLRGWCAEFDRRAWDLEQRPAEPMTDAQIFDACYREVLKRWGSAGAP